MPQCKWIVHNLFTVYGAALFDEVKVTILYKIMSRQQWENTMASGVFEGSEVDMKDGFIHLSASHQVRETARRHFAHQTDLMLVGVRGENLGETLRWEVSRDAALFPHIYGVLPLQAIISADVLPWQDGAHVFPESLSP